MAFASTTQLSNLIIPAYDRLVEFELREMPTFRSLVDRKPVNATTVSDTFYFTWYADLAATTTPLAAAIMAMVGINISVVLESPAETLCR